MIEWMRKKGGTCEREDEEEERDMMCALPPPIRTHNQEPMDSVFVYAR
jgi:hypothetical protein